MVRISDGRVGRDILHSEELVTEFTIPAERATERLGGVPIDSRISVQEQNLRAGCSCNDNRDLTRVISRLNMRALELLERARRQDNRAMNLTKKTLEETMLYRDFKAAGAEGILETEIASIILPLLADHVLREANHYLRILKNE